MVAEMPIGIVPDEFAAVVRRVVRSDGDNDGAVGPWTNSSADLRFGRDGRLTQVVRGLCHTDTC